jgi:hypothetical protein
MELLARDLLRGKLVPVGGFDRGAELAVLSLYLSDLAIQAPQVGPRLLQLEDALVGEEQ